MHANSTYASTSDYVNYLDGEPAPEELTRGMLVSASRRVDRALRGARYAVDADGMPTDCEVIAALRAATCAQVEDWIESGDYGIGAATYTDGQIGSVRFTRGTTGAGANPAGVDLAPKAGDILAAAGLLPIDPMVIG